MDAFLLLLGLLSFPNPNLSSSFLLDQSIHPSIQSSLNLRQNLLIPCRWSHVSPQEEPESPSDLIELEIKSLTPFLSVYMYRMCHFLCTGKKRISYLVRRRWLIQKRQKTALVKAKFHRLPFLRLSFLPNALVQISGTNKNLLQKA